MAWLDDLRFDAPGWDEIYGMLRDLSEKIIRQGMNPDVLVGISMGGLIPAAILADLLGLDTEILRVKFYEGVDERGEKPRILQDISIDLEGLKILLVDDVVDSGKTIKLVNNHLMGRGAEKVILCTLHYKPWSEIKPELYIEKTELWIIYPWERMETLRDVTKKLRSLGFKEGEIRKRMADRGVPEELIEEYYNLAQSHPSFHQKRIETS
jgi:hypothetical protein